MKGKDAKQLLSIVSRATEYLCELQQRGEISRESVEAEREAVKEVFEHVDNALACLRLVRGMMNTAEERGGGFWVHGVDWHTIKKAVEEVV